MGRITDGFVKDVGMNLWIAVSSTCPSLRFPTSSSLINEAKTICRRRLNTFPPGCLEYSSLLEQKYLKKKHWMYAIFMAAMESLPLLYQICPRREILHSVLGKCYLGTSSKLLDNLNDEIHTVEEALNSLENYLGALLYGTYERKSGSIVGMAESSACDMAAWIYHCLNTDSPAFSLYMRDCTRLVEGQISSLKHKSAEWPSLREYASTIAEKSIGDVWIDIDLCNFDELDEELLLLKKGNEYIFKSSLVYDDVQDLVEDIQTQSVNSVLVRGVEEGVITLDDLEKMEPTDIVEILEKTGIVQDIIYLADAFFLKGVSMLLEMKTSSLDKRGLLQSFRLVRLFNLRKLLLVNRDLETLKKVLESFSDFQSLKNRIPEEIDMLVN